MLKRAHDQPWRVHSGRRRAGAIPERKAAEPNSTTDKHKAYHGAEYVVVATPTDYDSDTNYFDTSSVEVAILDASRINQEATIVIKSTIPVGFTCDLRQRTGIGSIIFSPELRREGKALYDNLHPLRIVVGDTSEKDKKFAQLLRQGAEDSDTPVLHTG